MSKKERILEFIAVNDGAPLRTIYTGIKLEDILLFNWHIKQYLDALSEAQKIEIRDSRVYIINKCNNVINKEKEEVKERAAASSEVNLTHSQKEVVA